MTIVVSKNVKEELVKAYKKLDDCRATLENVNDECRLISEEAEDDIVWASHEDLSIEIDGWLAEIHSLDQDLLNYVDAKSDL